MSYIVDDIGTVIASMRTVPADPLAPGANAPYYMYGHRLEIANRLLEMSNDKVYKFQKYPLFALRMDFPERVVGDMVHYTLNIAILAKTEKNYDAEERMVNVFKPVLYPLYNTFIAKLYSSGLFVWNGGDLKTPEHTKVDRMYWGTQGNEANTANIFNDPLDAIELIDLKISKRIKNCS